MKTSTRERLENLLIALCVVLLVTISLTDPVVAEWLADRLLEFMQ